MAIALGKHLHEIAQMPLADYEQWKLYADIEPFGSHYDDLRAGQIVAATYNVNRDPKKVPEPFGPLQFTPWNDVRIQISQEQLIDQDSPEVRANKIRSMLRYQP